MFNNVSIGLLVLIFLATTSCGFVTKRISPATEVYTLSPTINIKSEPKVDKAVVLALSPIRASRTLLSTDIVYTDDQYSYNSYAFSRWSDSPAKLVELLLQKYLSYSPYLLAVTHSEITSKADIRLEGTLLDFSHHIKNNEESTGQVRIRFYLINVENKRVLATKEFFTESIANPANAQGGTKAINQASKIVVEQLIKWIEGTISQKSKE